MTVLAHFITSAAITALEDRDCLQSTSVSAEIIEIGTFSS